MNGKNKMCMGKVNTWRMITVSVYLFYIVRYKLFFILQILVGDCPLIPPETLKCAGPDALGKAVRRGV